MKTQPLALPVDQLIAALPRVDLLCLSPHLDDAVLSNPEQAILKPGGAILLARLERDIVGTCALIKAGPRRYELSKMAVTERFQGWHIGQRLMTASIALFETLRGKELYLESNSILTPALTLYEANGFVHARRPGGPSHYVRADVYMVYRRHAEAPARRTKSR